MKNNEFRLPLIQSGLVLVVIFLLIAFVAGSDAHGLLGGITSIFKGFFFSILFVIALVIAIIFSIILLIAIFLGAVALYSPDTSREMFIKLQQNSSALISSCTSCCSKDTVCTSTEVVNETADEKESSSNKDSWKKYVIKKEDSAPEKNESSEPDKVESLSKTLTLEMENIGSEIKLLQKQNATLLESHDLLKESVIEIPAGEIITRTDQVESQQEELSASVDATKKRLDTFEASLTTHAQTTATLSKKLDGLQNQLAEIVDEVKQLQKLPEQQVVEQSIDTPEDETAGSEEDHRIFSYIEKKKDKELFANSIAEAVAQDMSFAKIDDHLSQSLPKKIDSIIKEHPSLTKEYIREIRKAK